MAKKDTKAQVDEQNEGNAPTAEQNGASAKTNGTGRSKGSKPANDAYTPRLKQKYTDEVLPTLMNEFGYSNIMEVPRVTKVIVNIGMGSEARENAKALDSAVSDVGTITGQKAMITRAKKSIAQFKLREGMPIGVMVTLRGPRMYDFLDKLVNVALARVRDFTGISPKSFDGRGNFTLGLREQLIFPEIEYDKVDKIRGMEVVIVTTARNDEEGRRLLQLLGMPFKKS